MADLAGAPERSLELVHEALALAEPMNDPMITGPLHSRLAFLMWAGGESEGALVEHRRAVELVPADPPTVERAAVLGGLGGALMGLGRWSELRPICQAAIDCAQAAGAVLEESRARTMLGSDLVALGELDAGLEQLREAHRLSDGEPSELAVVTGYNLALNLFATDHLEEALEVAAGTQETARSGGLERRYGMELAALVGDILLRLGRWDDADRATAEGLALDQRRRGTPYLAVVRSRLVARRGNIRDALDRLETIDADRLEPDLAVAHAIAVAEASVLGGRPAAALDAVDRGMTAATESGDRIWSAPLVGLGFRAAAERADALRTNDDEPGLATLLERVGPLRARIAELRGGAMAPSGLAWLAAAEADAARLDQRSDPASWAAAVEAWQTAGDPYELAWVRYRLAESELRRSGVKADVATDLTAAWATASRLGAAALIAATRLLARRARIPLSEAPLAEDAHAGAVRPADGGPLDRRRTRRERGRADPPGGPDAHAVGPRDRGPPARRRRSLERRDRRGAVHLAQDRGRPRHPHPRQARRLQPRRGGDGSGPARDPGRARRGGGRGSGPARRLTRDEVGQLGADPSTDAGVRTSSE